VVIPILLLITAAWAAPLAEYGIQAEGFTWTQDQKRSGVKTQHVVEGEGPGQARVEIRILSPLDEETAKKNIEGETNALKNLYAAPQTPYMGDIAQAIGGCPPSLGPKAYDIEFLGRKVPAILGAASGDRSFGACTKEAAKFRGAFFAFYEKGALWSVRVTAPWPAKAKLADNWLAPIMARFKK
jgi:hypothetical protein